MNGVAHTLLMRRTERLEHLLLSMRIMLIRLHLGVPLHCLAITLLVVIEHCVTASTPRGVHRNPA